MASSSEEESLLQHVETPCRDVHTASPHTCSHTGWRIYATMYCFSVMGLFQSSIGVILRPLSNDYSLNDLGASRLFIVGPIGYILAAQLSHHVHVTWGQRGIAVLAPSLHILGALAIASHASFAIMLVAYTIIAFGTGFSDGSWCAWAAIGDNASTLSGLLQASFSTGAAAGPFVAGLILSKWRMPWFYMGYILLIASVVELGFLVFAFRHADASKYHLEVQLKTSSLHTNRVMPRGLLRNPMTWLAALFIFLYVGLETTISGWIVPFMTRYRNVTPVLANMALSAFWAGMAVGRVILGQLGDRIGVHRMNAGCLGFVVALQSIFAFIEHPTASVVIMALIGFFMGPMFISGIILLTRGLPPISHIAAVSFVASIGQLGAASIPFIIGALVQVLGIVLYRLAVIGLVAASLLAWLLIPNQLEETIL